MGLGAGGEGGVEPFAWLERELLALLGPSACCGDSRERKDGNAKLPTKMQQQPSAAKQTGRLKCRLPFPSDSQHPNKNTKPQMEVRHGTHASYLDNRQAWRAKGHPLRSEEVTLLWIKSECHHSNGAPPNDILSQDTHTPTPARSHQLPVALQGGGGRRRAGTVHCASGLCSSRPVSGPSYASQRTSPKLCFGTGVGSSRTKNRSPMLAQDTSQLV